tara:strand:- start:543 stop:986 length:444 start_codon:yes stop_codon:yes gene_type:complete
MYSTSLLKILYFSHGWHTALRGAPLVAQPFEAWRHGPVIRVVFDQLKDQDKSVIRKRLQRFDAAMQTYVVAQADIDDEGMRIVQATTQAYGQYHPFTLSDLTHEPDSPWNEVWRAASTGQAPGAAISNASIRAYFLRQNASDVLGIG